MHFLILFLSSPFFVTWYFKKNIPPKSCLWIMFRVYSFTIDFYGWEGHLKIIRSPLCTCVREWGLQYCILYSPNMHMPSYAVWTHAPTGKHARTHARTHAFTYTRARAYIHTYIAIHVYVFIQNKNLTKESAKKGARTRKEWHPPRRGTLVNSVCPYGPA